MYEIVKRLRKKKKNQKKKRDLLLILWKILFHWLWLGLLFGRRRWWRCRNFLLLIHTAQINAKEDTESSHDSRILQFPSIKKSSNYSFPQPILNLHLQLKFKLLYRKGSIYPSTCCYILHSSVSYNWGILSSSKIHLKRGNGDQIYFLKAADLQRNESYANFI